MTHSDAAEENIQSADARAERAKRNSEKSTLVPEEQIEELPAEQMENSIKPEIFKR